MCKDFLNLGPSALHQIGEREIKSNQMTHTLSLDTQIRRAFSARRGYLIENWLNSYDDRQPEKDYGRSYWASLLQTANDAELQILELNYQIPGVKILELEPLDR